MTADQRPGFPISSIDTYLARGYDRGQATAKVIIDKSESFPAEYRYPAQMLLTLNPPPKVRMSDDVERVLEASITNLRSVLASLPKPELDPDTREFHRKIREATITIKENPKGFIDIYTDGWLTLHKDNPEVSDPQREAVEQGRQRFHQIHQ